MICEDKIVEKYNEWDGDLDRLEAAIKAANDRTRVREAEGRFRRTGKYADPAKRITQYKDRTQELLGKNVDLQEIDSYNTETIEVKTAEMVAPNVVRINGSYNIDLDTGVTTDGGHFVNILGSETDVDTKDAVKLNEVVGTVQADMEAILDDAMAEDGDKLDDNYLNHLVDVYDVYMHTLQEAGKEINITVETFKHLNDRETSGKADAEAGKIQIYKGNRRFNTQTGILIHELQHVLTREVLKNNEFLKKKVIKLRDALDAQITEEFGAGKEHQVLLLGLDNVTESDIVYAKERYEYIFRNSNADVAADEFLAGVTTDKNLVAYTQQVRGTELKEIRFMKPVAIDPKKGKQPWRKLWNSMVKTLNNIYKAMVTKGQTTDRLALILLDEVLKQQHLANNEKDYNYWQKAMSWIAKADERMSEFSERIDKENKGYKANIASREAGAVERALDKLWRIKGLARVRSKVLQNNIFNSIARDMKNPDIAKFYQMFRHAKAFVENAVKPTENATASVLLKNFELGNITGDEEQDVILRRAAKRVILDTDMGAIGYSKEILDYLDNPQKIEDELKWITDPDMMEHINSVANLMVHNKMTVINGYTNAHQIAWDLIGEKRTDEDIAKIDKAISLVALQITMRENPETVKAAKIVLEKRPDGIDFSIDLIKKQEADLVEKVYAGDWMYQVKGETQEKYVGTKQHYLVPAKEMKELVKAGMINVGKHIEVSKAMGEDMYVIMGESYEPRFTEGLMSAVQIRTEGDSLKRLLMEAGMEEEVIEDKIALLADEKGLGEGLVPERTGLNTIYDYKIRMSYDDKVNLLGLEDDLVATVSKTMSNLSHKQEAVINNRAAVRHMARMYEKYKDDKKFKFVEVGEQSEGKLKEYWQRIPYYMKREIKLKFGGDKIMVEESLLVDFFGYQDVSMVNLPWVKDSKRKQVVAKKLENIVQDISQTWKQSVVAKTLDTVFTNASSNFWVAMQHSVDKDPIKYLKRVKEVWGYMNEYKENLDEKKKLEILKQGGRKVNEKLIKQLDAKLKTNPVHGIMEDGQYSVIMEDLNKGLIDNKGIMEAKIDDLLNNKKIKKLGIKQVIDLLYIRRDSGIHDSVMKGTWYMDAINKVIINDYIAERNPDWSEQERYNYLDQLHVNYSYLDNRWVKYANDTLVFSFTKYFFRVFSAMIRMLNKHAASVFTVELFQGISGIDFETPWDQFYDGYSTLINKVGNIFDPKNLFGLMLTPAFAR